MFTIEITLKGVPAMLAVQYKEAEAAEASFQRLGEVLRSGHPQWLDLTCEKTEKKVLLASAEIAAIQLTPKAGGTQTGTRAGFLSAASQS